MIVGCTSVRDETGEEEDEDLEWGGGGREMRLGRRRFRHDTGDVAATVPTIAPTAAAVATNLATMSTTIVTCTHTYVGNGKYIAQATTFCSRDH